MCPAARARRYGIDTGRSKYGARLMAALKPLLDSLHRVPSWHEALVQQTIVGWEHSSRATRPDKARDLKREDPVVAVADI